METWLVVTDWIGNEYADSVIGAVQTHCRNNNARLVIFTIGSLGYHLGEEDLHALLVPRLRSLSYDRLLLATAQLARNQGDKKFAGIVSKLKPTPVVSIGATIPGTRTIKAHHDRAFIQLLEHLWTEHGYRAFAWIGGPQGNPVAEERRKTFLGFLADKGGKLNPLLDIPGDFNLSAGQDAGRVLIPLRSSFEVVVAANDAMALGAQEILGKGVPITGFDDVPLARTESLTTVNTDIEGEIDRAISILAGLSDITSDKPVTSRDTVDDLYLGHPVFRTSCACAAPQSEEGTRTTRAYDDSTTAERIGLLYEGILNAGDMGDLGDLLNHHLPADDIRFWRMWTAANPENQELTPFLPDEFADKRTEAVIHSLFHEGEVFGFFMHDIHSRGYNLSEWLRINLSLAFRNWQKNIQSERSRQQLSFEIERFGKRQRETAELMDTLPMWIAEIDAHFQIRFSNRRLLELVHPGDNRRLNGSFLDLVGPKDRDRVQDLLEQVMRVGVTLSLDFPLVDRGDNLIPLIAEAQSLPENSMLRLSTLNGVLSAGRGARISGLSMLATVDSVIQPETMLFRHHEFTPREREAVTLLVRGADSPDIARTLSISEKTVRVMLHHIYVKTGCSGKREFLELLSGYNSRGVGDSSLTRLLLARFYGFKDA